MTDADDDRGAALRLMSATAVRDRANQVFQVAERDGLSHFSLDLDRLDSATKYVASVVRENYPTLDVPFHSRWRHFAAGGHDRWGRIRRRLGNPSRAEIGRVQFDFVMVSVLLDAGAGDAWRYVESETGETFTRSEGLAVASVDLFASGLLSGDPDAPFRVDATALAALTEHDLAETFQVTADNPLIGMAGRMNLLHGLADVVHARTDLFGSKDGTRARVGNLLDSLVAKADDGSICASDVLQTVLDGLGALWPGRVVLGGINLGDTWRHPAVQTDDPSTGLVPFHKLSQWLTYSLAEPLEACGITVTNLDGLTGLAEYRNGGLFVDLGVLRPKHGLVTTEPHAVDSEIVVEWRALTVALLDRIANPLRQELGVDSEAFPLAKVLEGGTWRAGRRIAAERRTGGGPPIRVLSEGTVF